MRGRVLLDVDGVLCDFAGPACDAVEAVGGRRPDLSNFEICAGLTAEQTEAYYERLHAVGWIVALRPIPGARAFVDGVRGLGVEVYFVTAPMRGPTWAFERTEWLVNHMGASRREVIIASSKHVVAGDALLDDRPENVRDWARSNPRGLGLLWRASYNIGDRSGVLDVGSFDQALGCVASWLRDGRAIATVVGS